MNFKKKHNRRAIWRKEVSPTRSISEWSRMLHKSWKRDILLKRDFKLWKDTA